MQVVRDVVQENSLSDQEMSVVERGLLEKRLIDCLAEFAAGAGHELNNPLAIISGLAQNLLKTETDPRKRASYSTIIAQTVRACEMIADVRGFARPPKPEPEVFDLGAFFEKWTRREMWRSGSKTDNIEIVFDDKCREMKIETDEAILSSILDALGKNANETIAEQGGLCFFCRLRTALESREIDNGQTVLEIGVENDGPDVTEQDLQFVYAPFFSGRQAGRGLGFGLSKAWRFSEILGVKLLCDRPMRFTKGRRWGVLIPVGK